MGSKKHIRAEQYKEAKKSQYFARLRNCPTSPRKMRLVADAIRGREVDKSLHILKHLPQTAAKYMYKLLLSAVANWQMKNEGKRMEEEHLFVKMVMVDGGRSLKRIQPAPQGRAHRIRKRSNHVTIEIGSKEMVSNN